MSFGVEPVNFSILRFASRPTSPDREGGVFAYGCSKILQKSNVIRGFPSVTTQSNLNDHTPP
jgi:hypothetical protein